MTFDEVSPLLAPALERALATHSLDDVRAMLETGHARLFTGARSALVAVIEEHPTHDALCLWLAGGDLDELIVELKPQAEAWGRALGCKTSTIVGRKGWARALSDYRPAAVVLVKEL